jgi:hypothetical protein
VGGRNSLGLRSGARPRGGGACPLVLECSLGVNETCVPPRRVRAFVLAVPLLVDSVRRPGAVLQSNASAVEGGVPEALITLDSPFSSGGACCPPTTLCSCGSASRQLARPGHRPG